MGGAVGGGATTLRQANVERRLVSNHGIGKVLRSLYDFLSLGEMTDANQNQMLSFYCFTGFNSGSYPLGSLHFEWTSVINQRLWAMSQKAIHNRVRTFKSVRTNKYWSLRPGNSFFAIHLCSATYKWTNPNACNSFAHNS